MTADETRWHRANLVCLWIGLVIAGFSLWLRNGFPVHAIASANTDDFLFIRLAAALRRAHWLGAYDHLILAKGPVYSGFIAVVSVFHVPLKIAEHAVYLVAAGALSFAAFRLARSHLLGMLLFTALAFNPVLWTDSLARVLRDGLYIGLTLGVFAAFALLWSQDITRRKEIWAALFTGGLAAAFWLTREEGIWMAPVLVVLGGVILLARRDLRRFVRITAIAAAAAAASVLLVAGINFALYRVFTDVEFRAPGFLSAYGALTRVEHVSWQRYILVPREVREKVYTVSPAAAELRAHLEGESGDQWRRTGCALQPSVPCTDILGGWFVWALRDAVAAAGHTRSGGESEAFYQRLADEVDAACDDKRLSCSGARATFAPPFRGEYVRDAVAAGPRFLSMLLNFGREELFTLPSTGAPSRLAVFRALIGPFGTPPSKAPITQIIGWVAGAGGPPTVTVIDAQGNARGRVELTRAPQIDPVLPQAGFAAQVFVATPECPAFDCEVVFRLADGTERKLALADFTGVPAEDPAYILTVDHVERQVDGLSPEVAARLALPQGIARAIAAVYAAVSLPLLVLGIAGALFGVWVFRREPETLIVSGLAIAAATAIASRIAILSYLDVSTFPTLNTLYLSSASPFAIVAAVVGTWVGIQALRRMSRARGS